MKIKYLALGLACSLTMGPCAVISAKTTIHEKVQSALDWQLPELACTKPVLRGKGIAIVDGTGTRVQTDTDSYTLGRYERKTRRYNTCIAEYKKVLNDDFNGLKNCVQYGLTKGQASIIMGKMKLIQTTITSLK